MCVKKEFNWLQKSLLIHQAHGAAEGSSMEHTVRCIQYKPCTTRVRCIQFGAVFSVSTLV